MHPNHPLHSALKRHKKFIPLKALKLLLATHDGQKASSAVSNWEPERHARDKAQVHCNQAGDLRVPPIILMRNKKRAVGDPK